MQWPRRRHHRDKPTIIEGRLSMPPGRLHREVTDLQVEGPPDPSPVPRTWGQAILASIVIVLVLLVLALLAAYMVWMWPQTGLLGRIAFAALGAGTAFTFAVFAVSLLVYVLPAVLGLRRPRGLEPGDG